MLWASPGSARGARRALVVPPYAGGTAQTFASTLRDIAADHDVWYLALPGRTHRASEPPATDLAALLAGVRDALIALGRLTTLLGYSLGARMALALAHLCRGGPVELRGVVAAMFDTGPDHDQRPTGLDKVVADLRRHHPHGRALDEAGLLDRQGQHQHVKFGGLQSLQQDFGVALEVAGGHYAIHTHPDAFRAAVVAALAEVSDGGAQLLDVKSHRTAGAVVATQRALKACSVCGRRRAPAPPLGWRDARPGGWRKRGPYDDRTPPAATFQTLSASSPIVHP